MRLSVVNEVVLLRCCSFWNSGLLRTFMYGLWHVLPHVQLCESNAKCLDCSSENKECKITAVGYPLHIAYFFLYLELRVLISVLYYK